MKAIAEELQYGEFSVTVKVHNGRMVQVFQEKEKNKKFQDDGSAEALEAAYQAIMEAKQGKTGKLNLAFEFVKGKVKEYKVNRLLT